MNKWHRGVVDISMYLVTTVYNDLFQNVRKKSHEYVSPTNLATAPSLKSWRMRGGWRADQRRMEGRSEAESAASEERLGMEDDRSRRGGWDGGRPEAALLGRRRKKGVTTHEGLSPYIVYY
jgi:hypothetical protein